ncbi:MAG: hypothetical protein ACI4QP_06150, partial [Candidatus Enteromonas sp.]
MKRRGLWKWLSIAFSLFVATAAIGVSFIDVGYAATSGTVAGWNENGSGIKLTYDGTADNPWTYVDSQVIGSATSEKGTCDNTDYNTTLTITCNKSGILSFDYTIDLQGGTIEVDGNSATMGGSINKEVQEQDSLYVKVSSKSTSAPTKVTISNLNLKVPSVPAVIRFERNPQCSYQAYINDTLAAFDSDVNCATGDTVTLKSPKAISGYLFVGWKMDGLSIGDKDPYTFTIVNAVTKIAVSAVDEKTAVFSVEQKMFRDLQLAIDYAKTTSSKIVKLFKSGQVEPKKDGSGYDFSDGVNLFIPGSESSDYFSFAKEIPPLTKDVSTYTCNYHLNILAGTTINFSSGSSLCVAGSMYSGSGGQIGGRPTGEVGELILQSGSSIGLNSGTTLYAWGYVSGDGDIYAHNGSTVYEGYAFSFRGGNGTSDAVGKGIFAFNQYYIQNIESNLHIYYGAIEKTSTSVYMGGKICKATFTFIGADGMFVLQKGCVVKKKYDPKMDHVHMTVDGNGSLSHIKVKIETNTTIPIPLQTIDSADYSLPITNNMDIDILSGSVAIEQNLDFLPGSTMSVHSGSTITLGASRDLYFYDLSNWVGKQYSFVSDNVRISYVSPYATEDFKKSSRPLNEGAKLILDGEIQCSGGVYMTKPSDGSAVSAKGKIVSNGGGKFVYLSADYVSGRDTAKTTKQYQNNSTPVDIATTTAVFVNSDSTEFSGTCPTGAALVYENGFWKVQHQGPYEITITFKGVDGTTVIGTKKYTIDGSGIELPNQNEFTGFQGSIFLWLEENDKTRSYEPNTSITAIRDSTALIAFTGGWYKDNSKNTFYYDRTLGKIKGLRYIDDIDEEGARPENLYCFDENGRLLTGTGVFFTYAAGAKYDGGGDDNTYYVDDGVVQRKGFATLVVPVGYGVETYYYYFGPSHYAYRNTTCYINTNLNSLLPEGV